MPNSSQRPEDVHFISGLILVSRQPERLVGFYRDVLGLPLHDERHGDSQPHWACELGDVHFAIHPAEDYPEEPVTEVSESVGASNDKTDDGAADTSKHD